MFTLKINKAEKITVQETQEQLISVEFSMLDDVGAVVATYAHGFPITATKEDIDAALVKVADTYDAANIDRVRGLSSGSSDLEFLSIVSISRKMVISFSKLSFDFSFFMTTLST